MCESIMISSPRPSVLSSITMSIRVYWMTMSERLFLKESRSLLSFSSVYDLSIASLSAEPYCEIVVHRSEMSVSQADLLQME